MCPYAHLGIVLSDEPTFGYSRYALESRRPSETSTHALSWYQHGFSPIGTPVQVRTSLRMVFHRRTHGDGESVRHGTQLPASPSNRSCQRTRGWLPSQHRPRTTVLPSTLHRRVYYTKRTSSQGAWGLFVPPGLNRILTATSISSIEKSRQRGCRYASHANDHN